MRRVLIVLAVFLVGCGAQAGTPSKASSSSSPSTVAPSSPASQGWRTARQAADEGERKLAAANQETVVSGNACPPNQPCIHGGTETDGVKAAYVWYQAGSGAATGPGEVGCIVYVYQDDSGWHFLNAVCVQNPAVPAVGTDMVSTPGTCANLREQPSISSRIMKCIPDQTQVEIDQPPTWGDKHMWWHLRGGGWMAHDNLLLNFSPGALQ